MNKKYSDKDSYSTTDISLAAAISLYYPIKSIDKANPRRVIFVFLKDENFDLLIEQYWNGKLLLNPLRYYQNLKVLKNRIYNE